MRYLVLICIFTLSIIRLQAAPRVEVKRGNAAAKAGLSDAALLHYQRALDEKGDSSVVLFDKGNLLYQQKDLDGASNSYLGALRSRETLAEQSQTLYNLGNSFYENQKYDKAIASYIESLKRNPTDADAKYNLELARRMLMQQQQQQQQQQDQKQDQDQKKDQQQQEQNQDQKQEQKQDQQQQQQPEQQQDQKQEQKAPPPQLDQQMSPEEAERILNALLQNEQNALKDAKKVKVLSRAKRVKDW